MSIKIMKDAWAAQGLTIAEKLVLLKLADNANDSGACWPSTLSMAKDCGCNRATVMRAIDSLEKKGHLTRQKRTGINNYYVVKPVAESNMLQKATCCTEQQTCCTEQQGDVAESNTNHHITINKPSSNKNIKREADLPELELEPERPSKGGLSFSHFEQFYSAYPVKKAKGRAEKAFKAAMKSKDAPTIEELVGAVERYKQAMADKPNFIKHPATWLNDKAWLDELPEAQPDNTPYREIVEIYNRTAGKYYPEAHAHNATRKNRLKTFYNRLKTDLENIERYFTQAAHSKGLRGAKNGWRPNLDWLIEDENVTKVIEGVYER